MAAILMIAYIAAAYWATNKIWWSKKVYVYSNATYFYMTRFYYLYGCRICDNTHCTAADIGR